MAVAVVDTNVLIDFRDENSVRHDRAQDIVHGIDRGDLPTVRVTDYVLLETLNWLHTRHRHDLAVDTYERLHASSGFEIVRSPRKDFHAAIERLQEDGHLSFGDATVVASMVREGLEYLYSFDSDFDRVDEITRLSTSENPFDTDEPG